jgi:hypothetical protein
MEYTSPVIDIICTLACSVHLVELEGTGQYFAMKAMDKGVMLNRNKVLNLII